ncbi:MAG: hypothetical protein M9941_09445 [Anaerolineae bacterium]|nr:hypothetical protein [Anaerolineae bacterium]
MLRIRYLLLLIAVLVLLVACNSAPEEAVETPTIETPTATATAVLTPTPEATAAPTPPPEPQPAISISGQVIGDDGVVRVDQLYMPSSGWVAVLRDDVVLGATAVAAGDNEQVVVEIDPLAAANVLTAALFTGDEDVFALDAVVPVELDGESVSAEFEVTMNVSVPEISISDDQIVLQDGIITIDSVTTPDDAWIVVYNSEDGAIDWDAPVGEAWVAKGTTGVTVPLRWREALPNLVAVLHRDADRRGRFDGDDTDPHYSVAGEPVTTAFKVILPLDVVILDQPITADNTVLVDRVISNGPGWVSILATDDDGEIGNIIGYAHLEDGLNEHVPVEIVEGFDDGRTMFAQVHTDSDEIGEFNYPAFDLPVRYRDQVAFFQFGTNPGNYVIVYNQALSAENTVTVDTAVGEVPMWVTIRPDDDGRPGTDVLGMARVEPGLHHDVVIEVDPDALTDTLFVVLHVDGGAEGEFEWPDGLDFELQRRNDIIHAPFALLESDE